MKKAEYSLPFRILATSTIAFFLFIVAEGFSYFALHLDIEGIKTRIYIPPTVSREKFEKYLGLRDPLLGWREQIITADGARNSPANEMLENRPVCVTLYGNSFTYGAEVDDAHVWGNLLAESLGCRVKNFGVSGYGVDHAILRFENNSAHNNSLVILGIYSADVNRNVNQWNYLLSGDSLGFKPSFFVDADKELQLEPIPINNYEEYLRLRNNPAGILKNEYYLPDGESIHARVFVSFPYSWSFLKLFKKIVLEIDWARFSPSVRLREWNYPYWYDTPQGPSPKKIEVNSLLVERFFGKCLDSSKACVVIMIPFFDEVNSYRKERKKILSALADPIRHFSNIWDATEYIAEKTQDRGICYYIGPNRDCLGHYNNDGNKLLFRFVEEMMRKHELDKFPEVVQ